jgi:hypothetical protein
MLFDLGYPKGSCDIGSKLTIIVVIMFVYPIVDKLIALATDGINPFIIDRKYVVVCYVNSVGQDDNGHEIYDYQNPEVFRLTDPRLKGIFADVVSNNQSVVTFECIFQETAIYLSSWRWGGRTYDGMISIYEWVLIGLAEVFPRLLLVSLLYHLIWLLCVRKRPSCDS